MFHEITCNLSVMILTTCDISAEAVIRPSFKEAQWFSNSLHGKCDVFRAIGQNLFKCIQFLN